MRRRPVREGVWQGRGEGSQRTAAISLFSERATTRDDDDPKRGTGKNSPPARAARARVSSPHRQKAPRASRGVDFDAHARRWSSSLVARGTMPPKKKKAKDEGPPLTEEEKLVLAQAEAMRVRRAGPRRSRALRARENLPRHPSTHAPSPSRRERRDAPPNPTPTQRPPLGQREGTERAGGPDPRRSSRLPRRRATLTPFRPPPPPG